MNPYQKWIPGFKENLNLVKDFASNIMRNTPNGDVNIPIWSWNCYQNVNRIDRFVRVGKLIEILYTIGSVYHSNTFEFQKLGFTELIYASKIPKNFYLVLLATLDWNIKFPTYGNYEYYDSFRYIVCFKEFEKQLENTRKQITNQIAPNKIYKSFIYTSEAIEHYSINTWNTRV